jgi:hypothetical protein
LEAPHLEHLREALDTNPDASKISVSGAPSAAAMSAASARAAAVAAEPVDAVARAAEPVAMPGGNRWAELDGDVDAEDTAIDAGVSANGNGSPPTVMSDLELLDDEEIDLLGDVDGLDPAREGAR